MKADGPAVRRPEDGAVTETRVRQLLPSARSERINPETAAGGARRRHERRKAPPIRGQENRTCPSPPCRGAEPGSGGSAPALVSAGACTKRMTSAAIRTSPARLHGNHAPADPSLVAAPRAPGPPQVPVEHPRYRRGDVCDPLSDSGAAAAGPRAAYGPAAHANRVLSRRPMPSSRNVSSLAMPPAREHLVEHAAESPDVGALVDRDPLRLFRTHVGRRAEDDQGVRAAVSRGSALAGMFVPL